MELLNRKGEDSMKGYEDIKDIISDIDEFHNEAELREILQQILIICEDNISIKNEPSTSVTTEKIDSSIKNIYKFSKYIVTQM